MQVAGGVGGGGYVGGGAGVNANYAENVPQTVFSFSHSRYAELDAGVGPINGSISANVDENWNLDSLGLSKGFGSVRVGPGAGLGAFFGRQGQFSIAITGNTLRNVFRGEVLSVE